MTRAWWSQHQKPLDAAYAMRKRTAVKPKASLHPDAPACAFCWPHWVASAMIEAGTKLPICTACATRETHVPHLPSFLWADVRAMALSAFDGVPA